MTMSIGRDKSVRRARVLLADPDGPRRRVLALQLRIAGHEVTEVSALREVPEAARQGIDLLVCEAMLEDGSAIDYATHVRGRRRPSPLRVMIATYDRARAGEARRALGDDAVLELPAAPSALQGRLASLLSSA